MNIKQNKNVKPNSNVKQNKQNNKMKNHALNVQPQVRVRHLED